MKIMTDEETSENELDIIKQVKHDFIVRYIDHFELQIGDIKYVFLITEYCQVTIHIK